MFDMYVCVYVYMYDLISLFEPYLCMYDLYVCMYVCLFMYVFMYVLMYV